MQARAKVVYENCAVLDIAGNLLFKASRKRLDWYLSRNLATVVDDHTVQLNFANRGAGRSAEPFYLQDMQNICVVCGTADGLTMHHVVPHQYRQHMGTAIKSRSSFDLLPACTRCHDQYERHAMAYKKHLSECFQAPLDGRGWIERRDIGYGGRAAAALLGPHASKIPEERCAELRRTAQAVAEAQVSLFSDDARACIEAWQDAQLDPVSSAHQGVLRELREMEVRVPGPDFCTHGEIVVNAVRQAQSDCAMCAECQALVAGGVPALMATKAYLMKYWYRSELIPLYATSIGAVGVCTYFASRALKNPEVVWDKTNNPYPWLHVKQNENVKLMDPNGRFEKQWSRDRL
ncbi:hypothetical protein GGI20_004062 [Coemansia sp. BCRC 34301]|nr:hypothetical protein GGI20_004062 [Coemansia sp. BCRC 34301]